jgi:hypothetical protein
MTQRNFIQYFPGKKCVLWSGKYGKYKKNCGAANENNGKFNKRGII